MLEFNQFTLMRQSNCRHLFRRKCPSWKNIKVCDTFEEAVDLDVEALEKQLVKYKEKQRSK